MAKELDIAVLLDCTGSMGGVIDSFKTDLKVIFGRLCSSHKCSTVRMALIKFRDHPPQEETFVTEVHNFTNDVAVMQGLLEDCAAHGGGDGPEAIADAMYEAVENISWNAESKKVIVLCTDAEPHGVGAIGDCFSNGCPAGHDPIVLAKRMAEAAITFFTMSTASYGTKALAGMCFITGGKYVGYRPNSRNAAFCEMMVGLILEDYQVEALMTSIHAELAAEADRMGTDIDEQELTRRMKQVLDGRGESNLVVVESGMAGVQQFEDIGEDIERYLTFENVRQVREYVEGLRRNRAPGRVVSTGRSKATAARKPKIAKTVAKKRPAKEEPKLVKVGVRHSLRLQFKTEEINRASIRPPGFVSDVATDEPDSNSRSGREPDEVRRIVRKTIARRNAALKR